MDDVKRCPYCAEEILAAAIKCKHCGSNVDLSASPPITPPLSARKGTLRARSILGIIAMAIFLAWILGAFDSPKVFSTAAAPSPIIWPVPQTEAEQTPVPAVEAAPPLVHKIAAPRRSLFKISAADLYSEYDANEVAMDQKIGKAIVEITGTISSIDKDFADDVVVHLATGDPFSSAGLTLVSSQKDLAASLVKGQDIVIRCDHVRRILSSPEGSDCTIIQ
jgi:hypothetical protein